MEAEVKEGYGTSVKTLSTIGERQITMAKAESKDKRRQQTESVLTEPLRRQILDKADLTEMSDRGSKGETEKDALKAGLAEAIRFGQRMDRLLNDAIVGINTCYSVVA